MRPLTCPRVDQRGRPSKSVRGSTVAHLHRLERYRLMGLMGQSGRITTNHLTVSIYSPHEHEGWTHQFVAVEEGRCHVTTDTRPCPALVQSSVLVIARSRALGIASDTSPSLLTPRQRGGCRRAARHQAAPVAVPTPPIRPPPPPRPAPTVTGLSLPRRPPPTPRRRGCSSVGDRRRGCSMAIHLQVCSGYEKFPDRVSQMPFEDSKYCSNSGPYGGPLHACPSRSAERHNCRATKREVAQYCIQW